MTKYRHSCPEWEGMVIDLQDEEIIACMCFRHDEIVLAIRKHVGKYHDLMNSIVGDKRWVFIDE